MARRSGQGRIGGAGHIEVRYPKDEVDAILSLQQEKRNKDRKDRIAEQEEIEKQKRAKVTLPKFSWDK